MVYAFLFIDGYRNAKGKGSNQSYMLFWSHRRGKLASGKDAAVQGDLQVKRTLRGQILRAYHSR